MFEDKFGNEVLVGDTVKADGMAYTIISKGTCADLPDEDEVLYGQLQSDMRVMTVFTKDSLSKDWERR